MLTTLIIQLNINTLPSPVMIKQYMRIESKEKEGLKEGTYNQSLKELEKGEETCHLNKFLLMLN